MAIKYSVYSMKKRLLALTLLVIFFAVCVISRLFILQVTNSEFYVKKGLTQWLRDLPLTATRGTITDRNGVVLASSYTTYDVYVRPADVEDFEKVSNLLSQKLNLDKNDIYENITKTGYGEVRIVKDIEKEVVQAILEEFEEGIYFTTNTGRNYAYDSMLCQILGFVGYDNSGLSGLESYYDSYLTGVDGVSLVETDLKGDAIDDSVTYYKNAIDGLNLELTIDFKIQNVVEKELQKTMVETGAKSVSAIVTNPSSGEILACATLPSYNLNEVPKDDLELLNQMSRATTIVDTFEPGSTFKAIVTAIALEESLVSKHNYFYCGGYRIVNGVTIRCSRRTGHGSQSLEQGLMNSCNCVFMDLIAKIGVEKFYDYLDRFGFTSSIGIDFPGEVMAVLMPMPSVTDADLARMGFGQTIALSAMQLVSGFSSVINGGKVVSMHFINKIYNLNGEVYNRNLTQKEQIFSEKTSETMKNMLFSVVSKGGGRYAKVDGFDIIGGKTGTAQKYENGKIAQGKYIASFIGFAPYDNPEFVVYVIVDEPVGAYYGGVVAAPVAGRIFEKIFEFSGYNENLEENANSDIELETFIGMSLTQSVVALSQRNLQYLIQGEGDYVVNQIPAPGSYVKEGDVVLLMFE